MRFFFVSDICQNGFRNWIVGCLNMCVIAINCFQLSG